MSASAVRTLLFFGQRPCVGFVLEGAVAVELEFGEERRGGRLGVVRLVIGVEVVGHRGLPPASDRAHRGLRRRRRPGADRACTAARLRERPQRSGGRRGTAILLRDAKARSSRRRKIGWPSAVAGPDRFRSDRPLRRPWARLSQPDRRTR